jgi:hypothetical protein
MDFFCFSFSCVCGFGLWICCFCVGKLYERVFDLVVYKMWVLVGGGPKDCGWLGRSRPEIVMLGEY